MLKTKKKLGSLAALSVLALASYALLSSFTDGGESELAKKHPKSEPYGCDLGYWEPNPPGNPVWVKTGTGLQDDCPKRKDGSTCTPYLCK